MFSFVVWLVLLCAPRKLHDDIFGNKSLFLAECCAQYSYQRCNRDAALLRALRLRLYVSPSVLVLLAGWEVQVYDEREHDPKL